MFSETSFIKAVSMHCSIFASSLSSLMVKKMQPGLDIENDQPNSDPYWNSGIFVHAVESQKPLLSFNLKLFFSSLTVIAQPIQIQSCLMLSLWVLISQNPFCLGFPGWLGAFCLLGLQTKTSADSDSFQGAIFFRAIPSFHPFFINLQYYLQSVMICYTVRGLVQAITECKVQNYNQSTIQMRLLIIVERAQTCTG